MSIPTYTMRFGGIWNTSTTYGYAVFVVSPADNGCYVWIGSQPISGGADPSVPNPDWVVIPPPGNGDITGVTAGTGLSGGGSTGVVTLNNAGVLSLEALTGALTLSSPNGTYTTAGNDIQLAINFPPVYQATYYKTANQNLTSGNTDITFDAVGGWNNDGGYITHISNTTDFTVVQKGLYQLEFAFLCLQNSATWTTTTNKVVAIDITRSPIAELAVIAQSSLQAVGGYNQTLNTTFYLNAGDVINCRVSNTFTLGPPQASGVTNTFDLNTFFQWTYISDV
jgi:hypothetical protein